MAEIDPGTPPTGTEVLPRVMLVDDEPLNLDLLRRTLQRQFEIIEADSAAHALTWLEEHDGMVSVILCDQLMPGLSGTQLASTVRARWPLVKFVLVTGVDENDDVLAAKRAGIVDDVVGKPWNARTLRARLKELALRG
jgi:two-component system response regulator HupR/HoxA